MTGKFKARPTRHTGVITTNGWRLKHYEITLPGASITADITKAVVRTLDRVVPQATSGEAAVGFVIAHQGAEAVWLLIDLWDGDIISQLTFSAPLSEPSSFSQVPLGGSTACVWDLLVHAHERDAFVANVLDPQDGPDFAAYLGDVLQATVSQFAIRSN